MISTKQFRTIQEKVNSFKLYYERRNTRPLLGFFIESEYPLYRYNAARLLPDNTMLSPNDFNVELYLDDCERLFIKHEELGGDFIWSASAFWGIPWLEVALGCNIIADHKTGSIYSKPPVNFKGASCIPDFNEDSPWMLKVMEFLKKISERSAGRWPIGTTRMRGISDLLSALYGGENFIYAMLEEPGEVKAVCEKLTDFWIAFGKLQLKEIPLYYGGVGSFYYHMWVPEDTVWHQEDAAALMNPELYQEFIRPCDEKIVKAFNGCIIHQHPTQYYPVNDYLQMGILALELHIDAGGPNTEELYQSHNRILKDKPLIIWGDMLEKDLDWIFTKLPVQGLAVNTVVKDKEQATYLWRKYIRTEQ